MTTRKHLTSVPPPTTEAVMTDLFSEVELTEPLNADAISNAELLTEQIGQDLAWIKDNGLKVVEPGTGPRFSPKVNISLPEGEVAQACLLIIHQLRSMPANAALQGVGSFVLDIAPSVGTPGSGYFDRIKFNTDEPDRFEIFYKIDPDAKEAFNEQHPEFARLDAILPDGDMWEEKHSITDDFEFEDETSIYAAYVLRATVEALKNHIESTTNSQ